jgi:hypothetical protein
MKLKKMLTGNEEKGYDSAFLIAFKNGEIHCSRIA